MKQGVYVRLSFSVNVYTCVYVGTCVSVIVRKNVLQDNTETLNIEEELQWNGLDQIMFMC